MNRLHPVTDDATVALTFTTAATAWAALNERQRPDLRNPVGAAGGRQFALEGNG